MRFFLSLCTGALCILSAVACEGEECGGSLPFIIILYGPQGSAKAAVSARLHVDYNLPAISPATYLTANVLDETPLGNIARDYVINGGPMPPDLVPSLLCDRLLQSDCCQGALLEDSPLRLEQVQAIQECLSPRFQVLAINIETSEEWIIKKAENRLFCTTCGKVFDLTQSSCQFNCDVCGTLLEKRAADSIEKLQAKVRRYKETLAPLLVWYKEEHSFVEISGEKNFDELYAEVSTIIQTKTGLLPAKAQQLSQCD